MIEGFRACVFPSQAIDLKLFGVSSFMALTVFLVGAYYFRKAEKNFADMI